MEREGRISERSETFSFRDDKQIDKIYAKAVVDSIYKKAGLSEPLIIWTQSPLENYIAKAAVDIFSDAGQPHAWYYNWWDRAEEGAGSIRRNAAHSILASGWRMGGTGTGYDVWSDLPVYFGGQDIFWCDIPTNKLSRFTQSDKNAATLQFLDQMGNGRIIEEAVSQYQYDFIVDMWGRYKFQMDHIDRKPIGGSRNMHLGMMQDKKRLFLQKSLCFVPIEFRDPESGSTLYMSDEFVELKNNVGHVMPFSNICFVSERANVLTVNRSGRLHCETGPAMAYLDGFKIHAWDGVIFPEKWIHEKPGPREAFLWRNTEQRRIACEMVGWESIFKITKAKIIDSDKNPQIGELIMVKLRREGDSEMFLRVKCGTGRDFVLPVPSEMKTAREANAWTWGLGPNEYMPEVRT